MSATELATSLLARIADQDGHGGPSYIHYDPRSTLSAAAEADRARLAGVPMPALAGVPISIKDLFDVADEVTRAGSAVLANDPPARRDAEIVARLRRAGAVLTGRTNMTEFAFSTIGTNPHHGTPRNPADPDRIPGGSSSGAATSVGHGLAVAAIGSDTAGSIRVPAAFCGLAGFKPSQRRISQQGMVALAPSLDSVGPIAPTIACCAVLDAVLAGEPVTELSDRPIAGLRFALPPPLLLGGMDAAVGAAFDRALEMLWEAGAHLTPLPFDEIEALDEDQILAELVMVEALAWHEGHADRWGDYDPLIARRLREARELSPGTEARCRAARQAAMRAFRTAMAPFDALLMPTVPIVAPRFDEVAEPENFYRLNRLIRRNAGMINLLDGCAATVPCHPPGGLPAGLGIAGVSGDDRSILAIAAAVERCLTAAAR